jgi:Arc/MetJ family transcription regulator
MATVPIDLDADLVAEVKLRTGEDAARTFIETAVRRDLDNEAFGRLLDELEAEAGPIPDDVDAEAERFWRAS